ncbi:MAG: hypothetical protein KC414_12500, partial [Romboutsia sp.]|nr:hypothetical protein [Romboutsia sp.]
MNNLILGAVFLIAGTCIGAGMLGFPVATAAAGFYPTLMAFLLVWAIMTFTALAMLEVSLLLDGDTNLISMVEKVLGKRAKKIIWLIYLLFLYSILAAYTSGGVTIIAQMLNIKLNS